MLCLPCGHAAASAAHIVNCHDYQELFLNPAKGHCCDQVLCCDTQELAVVKCVALEPHDLIQQYMAIHGHHYHPGYLKALLDEHHGARLVWVTM